MLLSITIMLFTTVVHSCGRVEVSARYTVTEIVPRWQKYTKQEIETPLFYNPNKLPFLDMDSDWTYCSSVLFFVLAFFLYILLLSNLVGKTMLT